MSNDHEKKEMKKKKMLETFSKPPFPAVPTFKMSDDHEKKEIMKKKKILETFWKGFDTALQAKIKAYLRRNPHLSNEVIVKRLNRGCPWCTEDARKFKHFYPLSLLVQTTLNQTPEYRYMLRSTNYIYIFAGVKPRACCPSGYVEGIKAHYRDWILRQPVDEDEETARVERKIALKEKLAVVGEETRILQEERRRKEEEKAASQTQEEKDAYEKKWVINTKRTEEIRAKEKAQVQTLRKLLFDFYEKELNKSPYQKAMDAYDRREYRKENAAWKKAEESGVGAYQLPSEEV